METAHEDDHLDDEDHEEDEHHEDEHDQHHEDDEHPDDQQPDSSSSSSSEPESPSEPARQQPPSPQYDEETQALVDEATGARERFYEAERGSRDLLAEITRLEEQAGRDYGPDHEFAILDGQCFEFDDLEYVYSLCPFGRATQRSKSGGTDVNLGQWNDWIGQPDRYSQAKFDRGLTCWNGPARSSLVSLSCGLENKVLSVSEPNRCEYAMELATPALCNPEGAGVADVHDEL